jgi:hypothetical protein
MRHELVRSSGARFQRIFACHLDVSTKRQGTNAVVGDAAAEADQALAESDRKYVHSDAEAFSGGIVAKLMHQDHDAEDNGHRSDRNQKRFHIPLYERKSD